ncbi:diacylglycerol kinase [Rhizobium sp. Leaf371]|uniref:dihydrofolate reductase n=1 Tax=Rhizobium sp. Leaf371 TaxID=1736355 RepID=UPI000715AC5F|nr:dihydrofolate reductase [Rhizobium sp. Leaf371]KQS72672.1 diacylglycerol kinase [Rhizobium sp. Leaf371]
MSAAKIVIVVAAARNGVIGRDGDMPWRLPTDLKHFKALTLGRPVVMGRKTWQSIGRPLPGRPNIVITRDTGFVAEGAARVGSLEEGLRLARDLAAERGVDEVCVIGGGQVYREAMASVDIIHLTVVDADLDGDTMFPAIDPSVFDRVSAVSAPRAEKDSHAVTFTTWRRRTGASEPGHDGLLEL